MSIKLLNPPHLVKFLVIGVLFSFFFSSWIYGNNIDFQNTITGTVTSSDDNLPVPGVNIFVKELPNVGAVTDMDGNYSIQAPADATLVFSFIGFKTIERKVDNRTEINVVMDSDLDALQEVVIVGYGEQKRETVVAAVVQASGEELERAGNVPNIGSALAGNVPGVITTSSTGIPGGEDPRIFIRGQSTWNDSSPLVLVDGIERPLNTIAISSVESISVLKDASATAVYGVRGANGVILVTTKRGKTGKAVIRARLNSTVKTASKLPGKKDAFDTFLVRNRAIENELSLTPESWSFFQTQDIIDKYEQIQLEMSLGDMLFFDGKLAHRSGSNITKDEIRFSLAGMWHDIKTKNFRGPKPIFEQRTKFDQHGYWSKLNNDLSWGY